jgi:hypothetical protein
MVGQLLVYITGPVTAGLQAQYHAGAIEAGFKTVECIGMADSFTHHREVVGIPSGHRGKYIFHGSKGLSATKDFLANSFRNDRNAFIS